jgi:hypothetical protein
MANDNRNSSHRQADGAHADAFSDADESLQHAINLLYRIFRQITTGTLPLTALEAAMMQARLQELVLQAVAVGGHIREQQAVQERWYY